MTYFGHIKNGFPVLDSPVMLPEGTSVQIEVVPAGSDFWRGKTVEEQAREQGVRPVRDLDDLGGDWAENEVVDDFLALIRQNRL